MKQILLILIGLSVGVEAGDRFERESATGVVTDHQTHLQWQDDYTDNSDSVKSATWQGAIDYCEALDNTASGGYDDWRLPNFNELYSIGDRSKYNPAMSSVFVNVISSFYWSATTYASGTSNAWIVYFYNGDDGNDGKSYSYYVRCVRGGQ